MRLYSLLQTLRSVDVNSTLCSSMQLRLSVHITIGLSHAGRDPLCILGIVDVSEYKRYWCCCYCCILLHSVYCMPHALLTLTSFQLCVHYSCWHCRSPTLSVWCLLGRQRGSATAEEPHYALCQLKYYGRFLTELLTRSSANAQEPCQHTVSWNRVKCHQNVRWIAFENVCKRWMTFKVIQGHCRCYHLIGHILFHISLPL